MMIRTNISHRSLAEYSAILYNHGLDLYTADGENTVEILGDADEAFIGIDYLKGDYTWHIESMKDAANDEWLVAQDRHYREGWRDEYAISCHRERESILRTRRSLMKALADWEHSVELVDEWEYDTDDVCFVAFPDGKKAVANIK